MTRLQRARLFVVGVAGLGVGLLLSPLPWLGLVVPFGLLAAIAFVSPEVES